jgi:hypothetical protein
MIQLSYLYKYCTKYWFRSGCFTSTAQSTGSDHGASQVQHKVLVPITVLHKYSTKYWFRSGCFTSTAQSTGSDHGASQVQHKVLVPIRVLHKYSTKYWFRSRCFTSTALVYFLPAQSTSYQQKSFCKQQTVLTYQASELLFVAKNRIRATNRNKYFVPSAKYWQDWLLAF